MINACVICHKKKVYLSPWPFQLILIDSRSSAIWQAGVHVRIAPGPARNACQFIRISCFRGVTMANRTTNVITTVCIVESEKDIQTAYLRARAQNPSHRSRITTRTQRLVTRYTNTTPDQPLMASRPIAPETGTLEDMYRLMRPLLRATKRTRDPDFRPQTSNYSLTRAHFSSHLNLCRMNTFRPT